MTPDLWAATCLILLLAAGLAERILCSRARKAVPIRIHVNGTRGKSTVTRLIWAALREAGIPALAKTTGTEPRLLLPDGNEVGLRRRGRVNIREQMRTLLRAQRYRARALVIECMAVEPELEWISEHQMVRATIGVITNVRTDHTETMGRNPLEIAASLSNTIPKKGVLIVGDDRFEALLRRRAQTLGSRVISVDPGGKDADPAGRVTARWLRENQAIALAVTRELGIPDRVALAGMARMPADPGVADCGTLRLSNRTWRYLDARAANDPESLARLLEEFTDVIEPERTIPIYNHRPDRPDRLRHFATAHFGLVQAAHVLITGKRPALWLWRSVGRAHPGQTYFVPPHRLASALALVGPDAGSLLFCGNTRGFDIKKLLAQTRHD